jgi:hypothetical protein
LEKSGKEELSPLPALFQAMTFASQIR